MRPRAQGMREPGHRAGRAPEPALSPSLNPTTDPTTASFSAAFSSPFAPRFEEPRARRISLGGASVWEVLGLVTVVASLVALAVMVAAHLVAPSTITELGMFIASFALIQSTLETLRPETFDN